MCSGWVCLSIYGHLVIHLATPCIPIGSQWESPFGYVASLQGYWVYAPNLSLGSCCKCFSFFCSSLPCKSFLAWDLWRKTAATGWPSPGVPDTQHELQTKPQGMNETRQALPILGLIRATPLTSTTRLCFVAVCDFYYSYSSSQLAFSMTSFFYRVGEKNQVSFTVISSYFPTGDVGGTDEQCPVIRPHMPSLLQTWGRHTLFSELMSLLA